MTRSQSSMYRPILALVSTGALIAGASELRAGSPRPGDRLERTGDEIVVCGQFYHSTAPVVLWTDPGGYDAYRTERRFGPLERAQEIPDEARSNNRRGRYGLRRKGLSETELERVRGGGWDLELLRRVVDQFVIHFDARGTSRRCFEVLQDRRGLSVHFMLDLDGTIYQTLDVKEAAWHATIANGRSIGIEVANIGAFAPNASEPLDRWYEARAGGPTRIVLPPLDLGAIRDRKAELSPIRDRPIEGRIQGQDLRQYDFTPRQYESLIRLTATLCSLFPRIRPDYPRDGMGNLVRSRLSDAEYAEFRGILGHYHVQANKVDPGPAFQWDRLIDGTKRMLTR